MIIYFIKIISEIRIGLQIGFLTNFLKFLFSFLVQK